MKRIYYLVCLLLMGFTFGASAQTSSQNKQARALAEIASPGSSPEWLKLRTDVRIDAVAFFNQSREALGLQETDTFELVRMETDHLGAIHYRYQQYAHGIKVHGAEYMLHESEGRIAIANGKLAVGLSPVLQGLLSAEQAKTQALAAVPSNRYWHEEGVESLAGELVWVRRNYALSFVTENLRLAWLFDIYVNDGHSARVFVDAISGNILHRIPLAMNCHPGQGVTTWDGMVDIWTDIIDPVSNLHILHDDCQDAVIRVLDANGSNTPAGATDYMDDDNLWLGQEAAIQSFFGARQVFRYFQEEHGRNSFDDDGGDILLYNNATFNGGDPNNACWNCFPGSLSFGGGDTNLPNDDWNTLDIVGHEFVHALTQHSAGLEYQGESGALNESFSDIFGEMTEWFTRDSLDWLMGGDRGFFQAVRDMREPKNRDQPNTYLGDFWVDVNSSDDNGGVHTNSGVQNRWFSLLAEGGNGTNDNGDYFQVEGIGLEKAARIAYRNLTVYLGSNSDYADAKNGAIQAAHDIFGSCSNEALQCARAWNAVGVNSSDTLGYDVEVNCTILDIVHTLGIPVYITAFNDIFSDCEITANGAPVVFQAGHSVMLMPGFFSGDNFHAFIQSCSPAPGGSAAGYAATPPQSTQDVSRQEETPFNPLLVFPNPFASNFRAKLQLDSPTLVAANLIDALGRNVLTLAQPDYLDAGLHTLEANGRDLPPGIYYLELKTGERRILHKVVKMAL